MTNPETHHDEHHSSLKDKVHHLADKIKHPHHDEQQPHVVGPQPVPPMAFSANHPSVGGGAGVTGIPMESTSTTAYDAAAAAAGADPADYHAKHHAEGESATIENKHHHHHDKDADPVAEHPIVHKAVGDQASSNLAGVGVGKQVM